MMYIVADMFEYNDVFNSSNTNIEDSDIRILKDNGYSYKVSYTGSSLYLYKNTFDLVLYPITVSRVADDWYYLKVKYNIDNRQEYYKCDQIDGLLQCLKDI